jgi:hypothetical protein
MHQLALEDAGSIVQTRWWLVNLSFGVLLLCITVFEPEF